MTDLLQAVFDIKQRRFVGIDRYGDNHAVEKLAASLNYIEVTQGNGIEATRIDGNHKGSGILMA